MTKLYKLELGNTSQFQFVGQEGIKYSCLYVKQIVPRMSNLTRICFTLNNYSAEEEAQIVNLKNDERIKYMIVGREVGESGTPHLQGYIRRRGGQKFNAWKRMLPRAHIEQCRGTEEQNKDYCSKEGDICIEHGVPFGHGKYGQYSSAMSSLISNDISIQDFKEQYPDIAFKHYNVMKAIFIESQLNKPTVCDKLFVWQQEAITHIMQQDDRKICFYIDPEGGKGKSTLTKYLHTTRNAFLCQGGKSTDIMNVFMNFALTNGPEISIFDMKRSIECLFWPYGFIKSIKDGYFTSTKYQGGLFTFKPQKVVVFSNHEVDREKFSADRYCVHHMGGDSAAYKVFDD